MNIARVVVLTIALSAGGVAAYLARGTEEKSRPVEQPVAHFLAMQVAGAILHHSSSRQAALVGNLEAQHDSHSRVGNRHAGRRE